MKYNAAIHLNAYTVSPSMRREWIEMLQGVGWSSGGGCLPPCGGSGLKCQSAGTSAGVRLSPSMRREWIEMSHEKLAYNSTQCLPPCGGSGLKLVFLALSVFLTVSLHAEGVD